MSKLESTPDWLNETFLIKIFQDELRVSSKELRVSIKSLKPVYDRGSLLRVNVNLIYVEQETPTEYSFIIKYLRDPVDDESYTREIAMYEEIIPALVYEWKVRDLKMTFAPKLYRTSVDPVKLLVIEDQIVQKSLDDLDMNHCKIFLLKLAQYHASTAVYYDKYTTFGEAFDVDYAKRKEGFEADWARLFPVFAKLFQNNDSLERYTTKITNWQHAAGGLYENALKINKSALNVLNHGDCELHNLIFAYNERNDVTDVLLIDFQEAIFNSPVYDLWLFLISSPSNEIYESGQIDNLVAFYHKNLVTYLKKLNYRMHVPSLKELNIEILQKSFLGCYATLKFSLTESGQVKDNVIQRLATVYKWLELRGMLDI